MAAIVNDRDLQLQATIPRTGPVTIGSNIVVDQSNVTGLGLIVTNSKWVALASTSQIFQIPKSGSVTPSSITVTAQVHNISGTPTLTIPAGGGTMNITPILTAGVFTFNVTNMTTDVVTLRLSATDTGGSGLTYTDDMTFVKVREGIDSINVLLTNESVTLPADYLGNILSYSGASGNIKVYQGINDVTSVCTFALAPSGNPSGLTYSLNAGPSGSGGAYAVTAGYSTGTNSTTLTFRITFGATVVDKVFTIAKSKAGQDGTNGTNGTNGARGSMQFYVAIAGSVWSSSSATSAVIAAVGGQILNDVVTEYNNAAEFAETRFWTGTAWAIINAVVDGNLLVTGTVGAQALEAGSVTASKLLVTDPGNFVYNAKGDVFDSAAWSALYPVSNTATGATWWPAAYASQSALHFRTRDNFFGNNIAVTPGEQFYCSMDSIPDGGATSTYSFGLGFQFLDKAGALLSYGLGSTRAAGASGNQTINGTLIAPANAAFARVWVQIAGPNGTDYGSTAGQGHYGTNLIIRRMNTASLIVDGTITGVKVAADTITASNIDSRSLTIKDAAGNVVFGAGPSYFALASSSDATSLGFNPLFNAWASTYPDSWGNWSGASPTRRTGDSIPNTPYTVYWPSTTANQGMWKQYAIPGPPLPAGSYLTGTFQAEMLTNNGGGPPGYLVRLYTNSALTTFVDTPCPIPDQRAGGWQRWSWVAGANNQAIYGYAIFQMASWSGMPASAAGAAGSMTAGSAMIFGPFDFHISTPISAANVSTFIQNAAIQSAQIDNLRTSNYAEDGSGNPTAGAKLSSTGTTLKVANSSLQVGTAIFTDYWTRLVQAIDGASGTAVVWRGNNDTTVRGGAPNVACLTMACHGSNIPSGDFQFVYFTYKITPTSFSAYSDNLDSISSMRLRFYQTTTASTLFQDITLPCSSRTYNTATADGSVTGMLHWAWRTDGTPGTSAGLGPMMESTGGSLWVYSGYLRANLINVYGPSADKDFGPSTGRGVNLPAATIGGSSGGGGGGPIGGGCPAPWVKVKLHSGQEIDAGALYNGARLAAVNDITLQPVEGGGVIEDYTTIWRERLRIKLTNGQAYEFSVGHRFAVVGSGWVNIEKLRPGDHIIGMEESVVESIIAVGKGQAISFRVKGAGTYFAGGLLCHNTKMIP